jgi:hypothetical protein
MDRDCIEAGSWTAPAWGRRDYPKHAKLILAFDH